VSAPPTPTGSRVPPLPRNVAPSAEGLIAADEARSPRERSSVENSRRDVGRWVVEQRRAVAAASAVAGSAVESSTWWSSTTTSTRSRSLAEMDADPEPVMCATSGPGMEWNPFDRAAAGLLVDD
jgi:hypothetical protein